MELVETEFKETEVGLIPVDWEVVELGSILKFGSGKDYKELSKGDIPVYGTGGIMTYVNDYLYDGNSVGIGRKGTIDKPVFLSGKFWTVDTLFYTHSFTDTVPKFIYYQFCLIPWKEYNEASGVPSLNKNTLENIKIPLPPTLKEQKAIATALSDVDALIHSLETLIAKKKAIKQGAMQELLTGKTRLAGFENDKGYQDTELGLIPVDWEVVEIGQVIKFSGGSQPPRSTFIFQPKEGYIRLLQIRDYKTSKYKTYIPIDLAQKFCQPDEIMIGRYGPPVFQILEGLEGAYNVALLKAIPTSKIYKEYARYFLKQEVLFRFVDKLSQRSSGQTGIDLYQLKQYKFGLPSKIEEQISIANSLLEIDLEIQLLEKKKEKYQAIKQGMMQELLTGKTRLISSSL